MACRRDRIARKEKKTVRLLTLPVHLGSVVGDYIQHDGMALQLHRSQEKCRLQMMLAMPAHIDGSVVGDHIRHNDMALRPRRSQER